MEPLLERCRPLCEVTCPALVPKQSLAELRKKTGGVRGNTAKLDNPSATQDGGQPASSGADGGQPGGLGLLQAAKEGKIWDALAGRHGRNAETEELEQGAEAALKERITKGGVRNADDELQHGSMRGDLKKAKKALDMGANINQANPRGVSPIMLASSSSGKEAIEVLRELLQKKADLQAKDNNGWACMHHACRNGKTEAAKYLMSMHADPAQMTSDHKTTLMLATIEGKEDLVKELMKQKIVRDKQVAERDAMGTTALHYAVKDGNIAIARLLVEHNAKVTAKDVDGKQPLIWAAEYGKLECAKQLAKKNAEIDAKDRTQRTALIYACLNCYEEFAKWLLKKNADPTFKDMQGDNAVAIADDMGLSEVKRTIKMRRQQEEEQRQED